MAYIEKESLIEFITKGLNNPDKSKAFGYDAIEILTEIEYAPTADVVPKSEVENIISNQRQRLNEYKKQIVTLQEKLGQAKADVAREIFAEIERLLDKHIAKANYTDGTFTLVFKRTLEVDIAELKKKYQEGE